jgi:hypothetical protein
MKGPGHKILLEWTSSSESSLETRRPSGQARGESPLSAQFPHDQSNRVVGTTLWPPRACRMPRDSSKVKGIYETSSRVMESNECRRSRFAGLAGQYWEGQKEEDRRMSERFMRNRAGAVNFSSRITSRLDLKRGTAA